MSHLVCPLCGKSAPLSTLNPDVLDLDIKVVRFRGLGYGRGFAKSEEYSILGDDEYSPILAKRSLLLCGMFINAGVLRREDVQNVLNISSTNTNLTEALSEQINEKQSTIVYLENQLKKLNDENELREEVDYLLREGAELASPGCMTADSGGWHLRLTNEELELEFYLQLLVRELPVKLKNKLLSQIINDENPLWFEFFIVDAPRRKSFAEILLNEDRVDIIHQLDANGIPIEIRIETVPLTNRNENMIHMKDLIKIVSDIKSVINDPFDIEKFRKVLIGF